MKGKHSSAKYFNSPHLESFSHFIEETHTDYVFKIISKHQLRFSVSIFILYVLFTSHFNVSILNFNNLTSTLLLILLLWSTSSAILSDFYFYVIYRITLTNILNYLLDGRNRNRQLVFFTRDYLLLMSRFKKYIKSINSANFPLAEERKMINQNIDIFTDFTLKLILDDTFNFYIIYDFLNQLDNDFFSNKHHLNVTQIKYFVDDANLIVRNFDERLYEESKTIVKNRYSKTGFLDNIMISMKNEVLTHLLSIVAIVALLDTKYEFLMPFFKIILESAVSAFKFW